MPFFGPLQLSAPTSGGDPRLTAFMQSLRGQGAQTITSYPGPGGTGVSALGYTAPGAALTGAGPLNLSPFLEGAGGVPTGAGGGPGESLTGMISAQQAAQGFGGQGGRPSVACFPASMQVLLADGTPKSIADIRPEDILSSWDEAQGGTARLARVVKVTASSPVEDLRSIDGLIVSDWHRLAGDGKWVRAIYVKPGDKLWTTDGLHEVQHVVSPLPAEPVWNLSVEPTHTFYVWDGERAWLVHNDAGGAGTGAGAGADAAAEGDVGLAAESGIGLAGPTGGPATGSDGDGDVGLAAEEGMALAGPPAATATTGDPEGPNIPVDPNLNPATRAMLADPKLTLETAWRSALPAPEQGLVKTNIAPEGSLLASLAGRGIGSIAGQFIGGPIGSFIGGQLGGHLGGKVGTALSLSQAANIAGPFGGFGPSDAAPSGPAGPSGPLGGGVGGPSK